MVIIRQLERADIAEVTQRSSAQLVRDAERNPMVSPRFDSETLAAAFASSLASTWVALVGEHIAGHLYGAVLDDPAQGTGAWVGPDGASFDDVTILRELYLVASQAWTEAGALAHFVWVLNEASALAAWQSLGFQPVHQRGVLQLTAATPLAMPDGYRLRRATSDDLDAAIRLTALIDQAQAGTMSGPVSLGADDLADVVADSLNDPDNLYFVVDAGSETVGQCVLFDLAQRRGSFAHTMHLSAVSVDEAHQGRGVATGMLHAVLDKARRGGAQFIETNWHVSNTRASRYWLSFGFTPTYVRLQRTSS